MCFHTAFAFAKAVRSSKAYGEWLAENTRLAEDGERNSLTLGEAQLRDKIIKEYREHGVRLSPEAAQAEIIANFVQDTLFADNGTTLDSLIRGLDKKQRDGIIGFLQDFIEWIKNKLDHKDIPKEILTLERKLTAALAEAKDGENGGVSYEINSKFEEMIDSWDRDGRPDNERFVLGSTGSVLQGLGARENDIYINGNKIKTIFRDHPEMDIDVIKKIPEILDNPILVLSSKNKVKNNSRMVMFGRVTAKNQKPVLCTLDLIPRENKIVINDMQKAVSAYSKTNSKEAIRYFFENSGVLYTSKNKKITTNLLSRVGFSMPTELLKSGYIGSITYKNRNVNIKSVPFNEVFLYDTNNRIY